MKILQTLKKFLKHAIKIKKKKKDKERKKEIKRNLKQMFLTPNLNYPHSHHTWHNYYYTIH